MSLARVFCIDDDYPILQSLRSFPWERYRSVWVGESTNGRKALEEIKDQKIDIVLTDIVMPGIDGIEFISRAKEFLPDASFLILSSYCDFDYARKALRCGATDYLIKGEYTDEELGEILLQLNPKREVEEPDCRYEIQASIRILHEKYHTNLSLENVAEEVGLSPNYFGNLFYQQTGMRFRDYLTQIRMERARELLLYSPLKVYEISEQVGIQNPQYFCILFQKYYGMSPGQLRKG